MSAILRRTNGTVIMPIDRLLDNAAFDPAAITALRDAYEGACAALQLADRTDKSLQRGLSSTPDAASTIPFACVTLF
jgi:hypothetical protein